MSSPDVGPDGADGRPPTELDPAELDPGLRYKLLVGLVVPRPIALVSTVDPAGRPNLAPYSFFNAVGCDPMLVVFCPGNQPDGTEKDSLRNAAPPSEGGTGAFVVHVTTGRLARAAAAAAEPLPHGESEIDLAGLTAVPARRVPAPRIAEAAAGLECVTREVIRTNPGVPGAGSLVLGEVVHVFAREDLLDDRLRTDPAALDAVGRMGGPTWVRTADRFDLPRGRKALAEGDREDGRS